MKRLLLMIMLVMVCLPQAHAKRKIAKAGKVKNSTFVDATYGFNFKIGKDWDYKIQKKDRNHRIVLTQVNYQVPPHYLDAPDYTRIPKIVVWVDTTSMGIFPFMDSLLSESYKSDQKKDILKEFEILVDDTGRDPLQQRARRTKTIAGEKGIYWTGRAQYTMDVQTSASSAGGKRVKGAFGGTITGTKIGNQIILFHMICEWLYYPQVDAELWTMVETLKFSDSDESKSEKK